MIEQHGMAWKDLFEQLKKYPTDWEMLRQQIREEGYVIALADKLEHLSRFYGPENLDRIPGERTEFQRDYARVVQSSAFRRLQAKTQLLGIRTSDFYRTRLTHSIEAAQIGRELALKLGADPVLVEAASLCHDIGNPPFGHAGEEELHQLMEGYGGFEGNAQGLRIVCVLEQKLPGWPGLNLTAAMRLALLKYHVIISTNHRKGIYLTEMRFIDDAIVQARGLQPQTIECQIVELADDIAYAAHDLEDGLKAGLISMDDFVEISGLGVIRNMFEDIEKEIEDKIKKGPTPQRSKHREDLRKVKRKELSSRLVNIFINSVDLKDVNDDDRELTGTRHNKRLTLGPSQPVVKQLKDFTFNMIVRHPKVAGFEARGREVIRGLFECLSDTKWNKDNRLLPLEFQDRLADPETYFPGSYEEQARRRCIADYIAGMTDTFAEQRYDELRSRPLK